jgi:outer membrane beta-barrel protein
MKRYFFDRLWILAVIVALPCVGYAQNDDDTMSFGEDEVEDGAGGSEMSFDVEEAESAETGKAGTDSEILSVLDEEQEADESLQIGKEGDAAAVDELQRHPVWAVQRIYALRAGRADLQPSFGVSLNDPYVQHQSISLQAAYYITEILSVGASVNMYQWLGAVSDLNYSVSRATHQTVPINEYSWGAQINFTYVPMYGKFAFFKEWILHWDVWIMGGGGFIFTRPIPVVDPEFRSFDYSMKFCFNIGIGGRLFLSRFLAIFVELRDYIFPEELESTTLYSNAEERSDKGNWTEDDLKLTNNVMIQFGVTLLLPFTFEYKLPK